ncbi:MAG: hypothetical protein COC01_05825 [Bacteroidetes bacterium]|nr:hypothetical protein [Bacteroidia bacterium]PCH67440.1 MAG: hypothetical protein COC01_05825 [Bacteroidota bacterium]
MTQESQKKTKNKLYFGFMFLQFTLMCVVFTSFYAVFQSQFLDPRTLDSVGHAPFVAMFAIIPLAFLGLKSVGKISTALKGDKIVFTNSFLAPVRTFSVKLEDIEAASVVSIKAAETPVIFEKKSGTSAKVFYVHGTKSIKLKPKKESNGLRNTLVFGTQNAQEWLKSFREKNIEILDV